MTNEPQLPDPLSFSAEEPFVAICMATYNPPLPLFLRQISSIKEQTHRRWVCVISDDASEPARLAEMRGVIADDPRFLLSPAPARLGFYNNFERSLSLAPASADYLALADQDDYWYPEKLQALLEKFENGTTLVYSDMRIVSESGEVISETYWTTRKNNYRDFASLMLANTVTGAASMFAGRLRDVILPFPERVGNLFHDHWIACVARAHGELKYIDCPLYDYVQHSGNVIGHNTPRREPLPKLIYWNFRQIGTEAGLLEAREIYFQNVVQLMLTAKTILERSKQSLRVCERMILQRIAALDSSWLSTLWLFLRGFKDWRPVSVTLGAEYYLLMGVFWKHYPRLKLRKKYD